MYTIQASARTLSRIRAKVLLFLALGMLVAEAAG
jgi:hypothetical protein